MLQSCKTKGENDMNIEVALKRKERGKKKKYKVCQTRCMKLKYWHENWNFCLIDSDKHLLHNDYVLCTMLSIDRSKDE